MTRPKKNYGINGHKEVLKNLKNVMKAAGQKYSIRVGIIGEKAYEKHPGSNLTNAELGAIHEFGADIKVTPKMRAYLRHQGVYLKKDTTHIKIPARSFLRAVLLDKNIKNQIMEAAGLSNAKADNDLNIEVALLKTLQNDTGFMGDIANIIAGKALEFVQAAFTTGGFGKWQPITELTKKRRKGDSANPPLDDLGDLKDSITVEVNKLNG